MEERVPKENQITGGYKAVDLREYGHRQAQFQGFVSRARAAELLSVSQQTIDRQIRLSLLEASRIGRRIVVSVASIYRLLEASRLNG